MHECEATINRDAHGVRVRPLEGPAPVDSAHGRDKTVFDDRGLNLLAQLDSLFERSFFQFSTAHLNSALLADVARALQQRCDSRWVDGEALLMKWDWMGSKCEYLAVWAGERGREGGGGLGGSWSGVSMGRGGWG